MSTVLESSSTILSTIWNALPFSFIYVLYGRRESWGVEMAAWEALGADYITPNIILMCVVSGGSGEIQLNNKHKTSHWKSMHCRML